MAICHVPPFHPSKPGIEDHKKTSLKRVKTAPELYHVISVSFSRAFFDTLPQLWSKIRVLFRLILMSRTAYKVTCHLIIHPLRKNILVWGRIFLLFLQSATLINSALACCHPLKRALLFYFLPINSRQLVNAYLSKRMQQDSGPAIRTLFPVLSLVMNLWNI